MSLTAWVFVCIGLLLGHTSFLKADYQSLSELYKLRRSRDVKVPILVNTDVTGKASRFELDIKQNRIIGHDNVFIKYSDLSMVSNQLIYDVTQNKLSLHDQVTIRRQDMLLTCDTAQAFFPDLLHSEGSVSFQHKDYVANAKKADYHLKSQIISLMGEAILKQGGDFFRGNVVKFDIRNEKVLSQGRSKIKVSTERLSE